MTSTKHWLRYCPECHSEVWSIQTRGQCQECKTTFLADKDGKLSQGFKNAVATNPKVALQTHVRDKIFAKTDKTFKEKQREWLNFRLNDAIELLNNVHNSAPINKVSIVGYSKEGGNIVWKNGVPNIMHPNNKYFSDKYIFINKYFSEMNIFINKYVS